MKKQIIVSLTLFTLMLVPSLCSAQSGVTPGEVRRILRENPDILLDVLRDNGDVLLDILQQASDEKRNMALKQQWAEDAKLEKTPSLDLRPSRGPEDAPITLVAFSDFTCNYCQNAAVAVENLLKRYPGKIRFVFKQTPSGDTARLAAQWFLAAYGLDAPRAWGLYALLFDRQRELVNDPIPALRNLAHEAGLDTKALEAALKSRAKEIDEILAVDKKEAKDMDFQGTPYFLVNDLIIRGALPLESFVEAVEFALNN